MNPFLKGLQRYFSDEQILRIQSVRIGLGGAGGLGSNIAIILARSGFCHFEVIDHDSIEASNLNRQQYFIDEIGLPKTTVLKKRLNLINPDLEFRGHQDLWSPKAAGNLLGGCDYIIEAFDQAPCKKEFVEFYQDKAAAIITGNGLAGWGNPASLEIKRMGNIYMAGDRKAGTEQGLPPLAPRVTLCASLMAGIVLDLTLGD